MFCAGPRNTSGDAASAFVLSAPMSEFTLIVFVVVVYKDTIVIGRNAGGRLQMLLSCIYLRLLSLPLDPARALCFSARILHVRVGVKSCCFFHVALIAYLPCASYILFSACKPELVVNHIEISRVL
jgi:hypothetical protein